MSKFYDEAYKWSLYEKYHNGFTLSELCEISAISDKSLHEWFKRFDYEYAQASVISLRAYPQISRCGKMATKGGGKEWRKRATNHGQYQMRSGRA